MIEQAFRIGSFANIPVRIHWSFFLLIFYIIGSGLYDKMDWPSIILLVAFTLCLFICVVLHEFGHALTAKKFGVKTADIILLPIGGVARLMNLPQKPSHELWIAIMGPVVNLIIAAIIFVGLFITYGAEMIHLFAVELSPKLSAGEFFAMLLQANILLMVFNLVPAFPMDGGRVLRALLAMKTSRLSATLWASRIGQLASIGFVIVGFYFEAWTLMLIGVFIFFGASQEYQFVKRDTKYKDKFIKDYYRRLINHFTEYALVKDVIHEIRLSGVKYFPVIDIQGNIIGTLNGQYIQHNFEKVKDKSVKEVMNTELIILPSDKDILTAMSYLESGVPAIYISENNQIVGIIDLDCIRLGIGNVN